VAIIKRSQSGGTKKVKRLPRRADPICGTPIKMETIMNVIEKLNKKEEARLLEGGKIIPDFSAGDTLVVQVRITEGTRTRLQAFEGVCIARSGGGVNESFTVRKISYGEGVERVFPVYSPLVEEIQVKRKGKVRRAKLYYLRDRRGKSARIVERTTGRGIVAARKKGEAKKKT